MDSGVFPFAVGRGVFTIAGDAGGPVLLWGRRIRHRPRATLDRMQVGRTTLPEQFLRRLAGTLIACFACAICCSAQTPTTQTSPKLHFRLQTRGAIEAHLKSFSTKNGEREALIRKWLAEAGCAAANLSEQAFDRALPPNVICVLPGQTQEVIVVGAHTDHVDNFGDGVVDNWTGAVLLPALLYSLNARPRHHTFIFVGFSAEEKGLIGSSYYADHLTSGERAHTDAMVNFDSLGLGPTEVWASHADKGLLDDLAGIAAASKLPVTVMNPENGASADSESFAPYHIPRITLHSVTLKTWSILHSPSDKMSAINMSDYYDSYRLIAAYLADLDGVLMCCASHQ
jgi:Peptidase family M28